MSDLICERCEEPAKPEAPASGVISRLTGRVTINTYTIRWVYSRFRGRFAAAGGTVSEMTLCSECWGAVMTLCTQPEQERRKIAAANRLEKQRKAEAAARRREQEINTLMREMGNTND